MASPVTGPELTRAAAHSRGIIGVSAAELVELSERVYRGVFRAGLWVASATALYALALVAVQVGEIDRPVAAATCLVLAAGLVAAARRHSRVYELLRRKPMSAVAAATIFGAAHVIIGPGSQLLFPLTITVIGLLGAAAPPRSVIASALIIALAQASPLLLHDLSGRDQRSLIAAAAADLFVPLLFAALLDRLAAFMLDLHRTTTTAGRPTPIRVSEPRRVGLRQHLLPKRSIARDTRTPNTEQKPDAASPTTAVTARQRQVIALASEGQRHAQIATCLAISTGQVTRHLAHARDRVGVITTEQLVAWAIANNVIPPPDNARR